MKFRKIFFFNTSALCTLNRSKADQNTWVIKRTTHSLLMDDQRQITGHRCHHLHRRRQRSNVVLLLLPLFFLAWLAVVFHFFNFGLVDLVFHFFPGFLLSLLVAGQDCSVFRAICRREQLHTHGLFLQRGVHAQASSPHHQRLRQRQR